MCMYANIYVYMLVNIYSVIKVLMSSALQSRQKSNVNISLLGFFFLYTHIYKTIT